VAGEGPDRVEVDFLDLGILDHQVGLGGQGPALGLQVRGRLAPEAGQ
jgi:hypothetical protein